MNTDVKTGISWSWLRSAVVVRELRVPMTSCRVPLLLGWCVVLFLYGLDTAPLYRTESLRAIIGAESLRGHWLYPVLYGEPFLTKPPGHYAAIAVCSLPFGEVSAASARIPSALAATLTVVLMWGLFRGTVGERLAFFAALLLPTSVLWLDKAPSAEIDMTLVGWVAAALVFFYRSMIGPIPDPTSGGEPASPHGEKAAVHLGWLTLSLLCVAAGTLTKWTAPAFFVLTVVPWLCWRRQFVLLLSWRHLFAVGVAVSLVALWAAVVAHEVGWDTLRNTIHSEAAYRFNPPPKARGYPWVELATYPLLVLAAHLPLALFALRTLRPSFLRSLDAPARSLVQFLHCWTWPNLIFWTLVPNHNVRYALPVSPALMALGAIGLWSVLPHWPRFNTRSTLIVVLTAWLIVKVIFVEVVMPRRTAGRNAEATAVRLREYVPATEPLYLLKFKDEGIMFYYGRSVRRVSRFQDVPRPGFAVLLRQEWDAHAATGDAELIRWLYDQQGDPLILVRCK